MLERIGYGPEVAAVYASWAAAADAAPARVLSTAPGLVVALTEDGPRRASLGAGLLAAVAADPAAAPCAGDWAVLRIWPDRRWTVEALLPRRTTVADHGAGAPRCANVDALVVLGAACPTDRTADGVELVRTDGCDLPHLRQRLAAGSTLAVIGGDRRGRAKLVRSLAGTGSLQARGPGPCLLPVPGGGALVDVGPHHGAVRGAG